MWAEVQLVKWTRWFPIWTNNWVIKNPTKLCLNPHWFPDVANLYLPCNETPIVVRPNQNINVTPMTWIYEFQSLQMIKLVLDVRNWLVVDWQTDEISTQSFYFKCPLLSFFNFNSTFSKLEFFDFVSPNVFMQFFSFDTPFNFNRSFTLLVT